MSQRRPQRELWCGGESSAARDGSDGDSTDPTVRVINVLADKKAFLGTRSRNNFGNLDYVRRGKREIVRSASTSSNRMTVQKEDCGT